MATLSTQYNVASDPNIQRIVQMAAYQQAVTVLGESPQLANHAARAAYASKVLSGGVDFGNLTHILLAQPAAANVALSPLPSDASIVAFLASLWDTLST
jgi:hypothetical protein